jgi:hypothetical protein
MENEKRPASESVYNAYISGKTVVVLSAVTAFWGGMGLALLHASNESGLSQTVDDSIGYNLMPDQITDDTFITTLGVSALLLTLVSYLKIKSLPKGLADQLPS